LRSDDGELVGRYRAVVKGENLEGLDLDAVAGVTALLGIAGAVYGPTINGLQRDPKDRRLYNTAADVVADWIERQARQPS
jgi:hypothetical protein